MLSVDHDENTHRDNCRFRGENKKKRIRKQTARLSRLLLCANDKCNGENVCVIAVRITAISECKAEICLEIGGRYLIKIKAAAIVFVFLF